jgi:hypothetical protein
VIATISQDDEELVIRPAAEEIGGPKGVLHGFSHDMQNGRFCLPSVSSAEVLQSVDFYGKNAEREVVALKTCQVFA